MNISTKEIKRDKSLADALHYQWADKDSQRQAREAAREAYRAAMETHGYPQQDEAESAPVEWLRNVGRRLRMMWLGVGRSEG